MTNRTNQALPDAGVSGFKPTIGDELRSPTDQHRAIEAAIAVNVLSRMPWLASSNSDRLA